jgi:hypothetical protein
MARPVYEGFVVPVSNQNRAVLMPSGAQDQDVSPTGARGPKLQPADLGPRAPGAMKYAG